MSRRFQLTLKRAFDIVISLTALTLLSPLMALIALAIKLDDGGPVLYVDKRADKGGKTFNLYKFRSMVVGADRIGLGPAVAKGHLAGFRHNLLEKGVPAEKIHVIPNRVDPATYTSHGHKLRFFKGLKPGGQE